MTNVALEDLISTDVVATPSDVTAAVAALVASAPAALDTLNELAAALGNDASYASTITTALAGKQPLDSDLTAIAALTTTAFGRALLELADAAAIRTAAGLGTAATHATGDYDATGAAAAAQSAAISAAATDATTKANAAAAASQPLDSDLTSIAALSTTAFGRGLLALADAAALATAHTHAARTVSAEPAGDTTIGTSTWTDVVSLVLPAGTWNVRGYGHFSIALTTGWCRLRIIDGGSAVIALGGEYINNAAKEAQRSCEAANVAGSQTVKLQGTCDASGTNKVTKQDGFQDGTATRIIASPA